MRIAYGAAGRFRVLGVAAVLFIGMPLAVAQEKFAPGLCVLPVKNSIGFSLSDNWGRQNATQFPKPTLRGNFPYGRSSLWTVSTDNALLSLGDEFPHSWLDRFAVEVTTGRVLGISGDEAVSKQGVYVFDSVGGRFRKIIPAPYTGPDGASFRFVKTVAHVSRLGVTLIGTDNGVFRLRGEAVEPWPGATGHEVGKVLSIADLPVHGALMLAGYTGAMLRRDDGSVEKLLDTSGGGFSRADQVVGAAESQLPGRIVAKGIGADREIEMRPRRGGGYSPSGDWTLAQHPDRDVETLGLRTTSGEYLQLVREGTATDFVLKRLEANGMRPVPGDPIRGLAAESYDRATMTESVALGLVLIGVKGGWYAYDGNRVSTVSGPTSALAGLSRLPASMASIGKTVLVADRQLFEFTTDRRITPIGLGFLGAKVEGLSELASAGVGLIATTDNLYALARDGTVRPIRGAELDTYGFLTFLGFLPSLEATLVRGRSSLRLVRHGPVCLETSHAVVP